MRANVIFTDVFNREVDSASNIY